MDRTFLLIIGAITDRMPALIADEHWAKWLGEEPATLDELKAILNPSELDMTMAPEQRSKPAPPRMESKFLPATTKSTHCCGRPNSVSRRPPWTIRFRYTRSRRSG